MTIEKRLAQDKRIACSTKLPLEKLNANAVEALEAMFSYGSRYKFFSLMQSFCVDLHELMIETTSNR